MAYVPLGVRTEYSFLDGMCRIEPLVERARALRFAAVGIADVHSTYAFVPFQLAARAAGVRPIFGVTVRLQADVEAQASWGPDPVHIRLFARDAGGYRNLLALVSRAHLECGGEEPGVGFQDLERFASGLLVLDGGMAGPVAQSLAQGARDDAERVAARLREIFGADSFGIELQRSGAPEGALVEPFLLHLGRRLNAPVVATSDVRYLEPADADAHDVLRCIAAGTTLPSAAGRRFGGEPHVLRSEPEMRHLFRDLPEALANTCLIAERCQFDLELGPPRALVAPTRSGRVPFEELRREAERGARRRYGIHDYEDLPAAVRDRLAHELSVIGELELASCFLVAQGVVRNAREESISVGPGRGAAAGSLVCYAIGVTDIDPLAHGLLFERFVARSSGRWPEFEFDVEHRRRDALAQRVVRELGSERVAMAASLTTLSTRSAVREVAQALGFAADEIEALARSLHAEGTTDLWQALDRSRDLKRSYQEDVRVRRLLDVARRLEGLPRNPTLHAGGLLVAPGAITEVAALARARSGEVVAQLDGESAAAVGLLRLELVASRALTLLADVRRRVAQLQDRAPAAQEEPREEPAHEYLSLDDKAAFRVLGSGDTHGIVHFEGPSVQAMLRALEPASFEDLVAVLCLSRPGARAAGLVNRYLACRRDGTDEEIVDDRLRPILGPTHGLVLYQEQTMEIAAAIGGYDLDAAESLRLALQRRRIGDLARHRARFLRGAVERGLDLERTEQVFAALLRFANFDFDKAHGVGQALLGYACARARAHHPLEFAAAVLDEAAGQGQRLREAAADVLANGIEILPLDVNRSQGGFAVEGAALRMGLGSVRRLGEPEMELILEERAARGPFVSMADFCSRLPDLPRVVFDALARAGAFASLGANRAQALHFVDIRLWAAEHEAGPSIAAQLQLDFGPGMTGASPDGLVAIPELSEETLAELDAEALEIDLREIRARSSLPRDPSVLRLPFALELERGTRTVPLPTEEHVGDSEERGEEARGRESEAAPLRLRSGTHASVRGVGRGRAQRVRDGREPARAPRRAAGGLPPRPRGAADGT